MTTTARAAVVTWGAAVTALVALLAPGDWRVAAGVPLLGTWAVWRWTAPGGRHAGPGRTSPRPGPTEPPVSVLGPFYGSMALDAELDWQARTGGLPRGEAPEVAHDEYPPEIPPVLMALADDAFMADVRRACACEPDPDDVWPESEHPSPPFLPAAPPSAAGTGTAGEAAGEAPAASPADGWDAASLAELRDAPSVLDEPQWHYRSERLAGTGEIAMAPIRAEWAAQLEDQDADARSFLRQLEQSALHYRLGLAGSL